MRERRGGSIVHMYASVHDFVQSIRNYKLLIYQLRQFLEIITWRN